MLLSTVYSISYVTRSTRKAGSKTVAATSYATVFWQLSVNGSRGKQQAGDTPCVLGVEWTAIRRVVACSHQDTET